MSYCKDHDRLLEKAFLLKLKEGEIVPNEKSPCCDNEIKFTANSGVYIMPGIYCGKCNELL